VVFAVVGMNVVSGHYPTSDCRAKGISSEAHKEGTCEDDGTKQVVVNQHSVLKLDSLEARIEGIQVRQEINGPPGSKAAQGPFVTFDLALTNRTDGPATLSDEQTRLLAGRGYEEDLAIDEAAPRAFLARPIPPGKTEDGTVTFALPAKQVKAMREEGNLDIGNFGAATADGDYEPEAMFEGSEYGVMRTYQ
jgi:hypothetical protein